MREDCILELKNIYKDYPGVRAVNNVSLQFNKREVHCIVGENGAGKSTLIKMLTGAVDRDSGEIVVHNKNIGHLTPILSRNLGIGAIYQEGSLVENLDIVENVFLGNERRNFIGVINRKWEEKEVKKYFVKLGIDSNIDLKQKARDISPALRQTVELIKILALTIEIIIFDEPTSSLDIKDINILLSIIDNLKNDNKSIIFISHKIEEVQKIANKVSVMRDGNLVKTFNNDLTKKEIISLMSGKEISGNISDQSNESDSRETLLAIKNLSYGNFIKSINFELKQGEILGITGLVGSGKSEIAESIFGFRKPNSIETYIKGIKVNINTPQDAIRNGIGLVTEDRKLKGLILGMMLKENLTIAALNIFSRFGFLNFLKEKKECKKIADSLNIKYTSFNDPVMKLSGGNQQKVMLGKWMIKKPIILIMDEPTRGVDVATKYEIYKLIRDIAKMGTSFLIFSSEIEEIIEISDRIIVLKEGRIVKEFKGRGVTRFHILESTLIEK